MCFYLFLILEILSLSLVQIQSEIALLQSIVGLYIAYYVGCNPTIQNINCALVLFLYGIWIFITQVCTIDYSLFAQYIEKFVLAWFLAFERFKSYELKTDEYNPNHVMIALYHRKSNLRSYILGLFGYDLCSMAIICDGHIAQFSWKSSDLIVKRVNVSKIKKKYLLIDTGIKPNKEILHKFYGAKDFPARRIESLWLRLNCVRTFKYLLNTLGDKWKYRPFDFIPGFYAYRRKLCR